MATKSNKTGEPKLSSLGERLLLQAFDNIAHTLRPYPEDVKTEELEGTINVLRSFGLVHGVGSEPNLTRAGVEAAERLLVARSKKQGDEKADTNAKSPEGTGAGDGDDAGDGDGAQP